MSLKKNHTRKKKIIRKKSVFKCLKKISVRGFQAKTGGI
jgi:hypothetical protein